MYEILDIILRSTAVYLFMVIAIRLSGRKELSQLNTSDVVLILLISNAVQNAMVGPDTSLLGGLIAAASLFLLNLFLKRVVFRNRKLRELVLEKPVILVHEGKPDARAMDRLGITRDELEEAMREHGVDTLKDVKLAMFEIDGNISIITGDEKLKQTYYRRKRKHKSLTDL
ncbi:MAG: DUF421 domain-containing protein [Bacteroidia bacterium]|nr:DUF421 domain-containing protein [Bacteroidia bacterium]